MAVALNDRRPFRPPEPAKRQGLSDEPWKLIERCWDTDPGARPSAEEIVEGISNILPQSHKHRAEGSVVTDMPDDFLSSSFWIEGSHTLTFPDNFATVTALLKRGQRWVGGALWTLSENFEETPQECSLERMYRTTMMPEYEPPGDW